MVNTIQAATKHKSCSYPLYSSSSDTTNKKPQIFIAEPNHFQAPVTINYFKQKQIKFSSFKRGHWRSRKPQYEATKERFNICRWYKRKKALKSLKDEAKKEQKKEWKKKREDYEQERINEITLWEYKKQQNAIKEEKRRKERQEYEKERINNIIRSAYSNQDKEIKKQKPRLRFAPLREKKQEVTIIEKKKKHRPWSRLRKNQDFPVEKRRKETKTFIKQKSTNAKPLAKTKQVSVKKYKPKESLTSRFVNCCYRVCCQFYCCLTCILLIAFVIFFIV